MNATVDTRADVRCYSEESLIDYHLGECSDSRRAEIREHVHRCGRCAITLLDISEFFRPSESGHESRKEPPAPLPDVEIAPDGPAFPSGLLISFLLGVLAAGLLFWLLEKPDNTITELLTAQQGLERRAAELEAEVRLQQERVRVLTLPQPNIVVELVSPATAIEAPPAGFVTVVVKQAHGVMRAELRGEEKTVWRQTSPRIQSDGKLSFAIPRASLPDGEYELLLEKQQATRQYNFRVATTR